MLPLINAAGTYAVAQPFTVESGAIYKCTGIVRISTLLADNTPVYTEVYEPYGIDNVEYTEDVNNDLHIVTLQKLTDGSLLVLPERHILRIPSVATIPYSQIILSADMGHIPDALSVQSIMDAIADNLSDIIGIRPTVQIHRVPVKTPVTVEEHTQFEANRLAAVAYRQSPYAELQHLTNQLDEKINQIRILEEALVALR